MLETACSYAGGAAEWQIGRWLAQAQGGRSGLQIATKCCHPADGASRFSPAVATVDLKKSLRRLGVDSIDLLIVHRDCETSPLEPMIERLHQLCDKGFIRAYGLANWRISRVNAALSFAQRERLRPPAVVSAQFSLASPIKLLWDGCISYTEAEVAWAISRKLSVFAWSAQARGWFARHHTGRSDKLIPLFDTPVNRQWRDKILRFASVHGCSPVALALAHTLRLQGVHATIGPRSAAELLESLTALELLATHQNFFETSEFSYPRP